jgi:hypothetical protein
MGAAHEHSPSPIGVDGGCASEKSKSYAQNQIIQIRQKIDEEPS